MRVVAGCHTSHVLAVGLSPRSLFRLLAIFRACLPQFPTTLCRGWHHQMAWLRCMFAGVPAQRREASALGNTKLPSALYGYQVKTLVSLNLLVTSEPFYSILYTITSPRDRLGCCPGTIPTHPSRMWLRFRRQPRSPPDSLYVCSAHDGDPVGCSGSLHRRTIWRRL